MSLRALGMLDRAGLRKIATDCGFDVLEDGANWVEAASTQAPLRAWLGLSMDGPVLGLSMLPVLMELPATPMPSPPPFYLVRTCYWTATATGSALSPHASQCRQAERL
jgi:hypothetical protein